MCLGATADKEVIGQEDREVGDGPQQNKVTAETQILEERGKNTPKIQSEVPGNGDIVIKQE